MAIDAKTLAAAKKYTDNEVAGAGAIKGKNCVVDSIIDITGGHRVTFKWTLDNGTVQTNYMDVMDGADGQDGDDGRGISSVDIDQTNNHLIITYDDGTDYDAGEIKAEGQTIQRNVLPTASADELGNIYQYIGATTADYTNGYFYQCVADGAGYKWENKKVQAGGGSGVDNFKDLDDVDFGTLTDGDLPQYDQTSGKWKNSNQIPLDIQNLQGSMAGLQLAIQNLDLLVASKVDKEAGKGLSSNDFTDSEKEKLGKLQPIYLIGSGLNLDGSVLKATGIDIPIDQHLDPESSNPVQNKAIAVPVEALQGSMAQVKLDVDDLKASDVGIKSDIANIKLDIDDLKASDVGIKSDIANIKLDIDDLKASDISIKLNVEQLQGSMAQVKLDISQLEGSLGSAAYKNSTSSVSSGSTDLVESGAVKDAIDAAISAVYKPSGDKTVAQLTNALLIQDNLGNVYNITDTGTTTADFVGGAGKPINAGDNVAIVDVGTLLSPSYKFDLLSGFVDLTNYIQKSVSATGLLKDNGDVDTTPYAPSANTYLVGDTAETTIDDEDYFPFYDTSAPGKRKTLFSSIVNKLKATFATLVSGATQNDIAVFDANGGVADSNVSIINAKVEANGTSGSHINLNDYKTAGTYFWNPLDVTTTDNAPSGINQSNSLLVVSLRGVSTGSVVELTQTFYHRNSQGIYVRYCYSSNNWTTWKKLSYSNEVATIAPTPASGLTESDIVNTVNGAVDTNANAPSLYGIQKYSNEKKVRRVLNGANVPSGTSMTATGIGTWTDKSIDQIVAADEADWWYDAAFQVPTYYMLTTDTVIVTGKTYYTRSGSGTSQDPYVYTAVANPVVGDIGTYYEEFSDDVDVSIKFDPKGDAVTLGGYILDTTTGKICIKFGNSISLPTARIGVDITYTRNEVG